jgi:mannose/fructose/N-acetylgalactosamine-specific phosphotransferase system component IID
MNDFNILATKQILKDLEYWGFNSFTEEELNDKGFLYKIYNEIKKNHTDESNVVEMYNRYTELAVMMN